MIASSFRAAIAAPLFLGLVAIARAGEVLDKVRAAGVVSCAVSRQDDDYSKFQTHGDLSALGLDVCRAVAAAVLGDAGKMRAVSYPDDAHGLDAVRSGAAALFVGATPDVTNGQRLGVAFGPPVLLEGQGFLVHRLSGIHAPADLAGRKVCFISETDLEQTLIAQMHARGIAYQPFPFEEMGEMEAALVAGHCDAITADASALADMRSGFHARIGDYVILPQTISKDPAAPAFRADDPAWAAIVGRTVDALVQAEESGVTQVNAAAQRDAVQHDDADPALKALLGPAGGVGPALGLDSSWALRAIEAVGNYGEMFRRDLGDGSPLHLARGANALWTEGGAMVGMPLR